MLEDGFTSLRLAVLPLHVGAAPVAVPPPVAPPSVLLLTLLPNLLTFLTSSLTSELHVLHRLPSTEEQRANTSVPRS